MVFHVNPEANSIEIPKALGKSIKEFVDASMKRLASKKCAEIKSLFENFVYAGNPNPPQDCAEFLNNMRQYYLNHPGFDLDAKTTNLFHSRLKQQVNLKIQLREVDEAADEARIEAEVQRRLVERSVVAQPASNAAPIAFPIDRATLQQQRDIEAQIASERQLKKASAPNLALFTPSLALFTPSKEITVTPQMLYVLFLPFDRSHEMDPGFVYIINHVLSDEDVCNLLTSLPDYPITSFINNPKSLFFNFFSNLGSGYLSNLATAINKFPQIAKVIDKHFKSLIKGKDIPNIPLDQLPVTMNAIYEDCFGKFSIYIHASFATLTIDEMRAFITALRINMIDKQILISNWTEARGNFFDKLERSAKVTDLLENMLKFPKLHEAVVLIRCTAAEIAKKSLAPNSRKLL